MDEAVALSTPAARRRRRWLMAPRVFAKLLQLAEIGEGDRVLDVGTGTGYSAAVLGRIVQNRRRARMRRGARRRRRARPSPRSPSTTSASSRARSPRAGSTRRPTTRSCSKAPSPSRPATLLDQLKDGGRLVGVIRNDGLGKATIWRRLGRSLDQWTAFDAAAPPLAGVRAGAGVRVLTGAVSAAGQISPYHRK